MNITLDHIMPVPLASITHGADSVWGNKIALQAGKRILLNASSGKGKSTFTTTVYGLRKDYTGSLTYDGADIATFSPDQWTDIRKHKIAAIFQDLQLFPKLSLGENLILKNRLTNLYSEVEIMKMLQLLEMDHKWEQQCGLLSMGQQQRVAVVRAMLQPYEWLLMDEPFSHLDVDNAKRAMRLIHDRSVEQNAGFVLTTLGDSHGYDFDQELKL